jgi:site-specific DNA-methyltransferase (adenine-specific)
MLQINSVNNGNCLDLMSDIDDKSIDMILCDLPYGTTACKWDSVIPFEQLWAHYKRIIKDNGAIVLTASQPFTSALVMSNIKMFKYEWIWVKNRVTGFANAKKRPLKNYEDILIFSNGTPRYHPQGLEKIDKIVKNGKSVGGNTMRPSIESDQGKGRLRTVGESYLQEFTSYPRQVITNVKEGHKKEHPTQKPVALFEYLIKTYTNEGELVLDNCAGSGTTAIACLRTNRNYILIEQETKYCDIANKRIAEFTP